MILRRYGKNYVSVTPNFDSRAMTEIGFRRNSELIVEADEFGDRYEFIESRELKPTKTGGVQGEVEEALLKELGDELGALASSLAGGQVVVIENEQGVDHPKTRGRQVSDASRADTRIAFEYTVDPPLRIGIYRSK
jgi:hypothetical protein